MKKFSLNIKEKRIYFYTDSSVCINKLKEGKSILKTIPCDIKYLGDFGQIDEEQNYICFLNRNTKVVKIDKINCTAFITEDEENIFFPDFVYLAICMFAGLFQKDNEYFLQASAVKYDEENSVMFIGDPGSGKTTSAYLIARDMRGSLISNDNVLVGMDECDLKTYAGTHRVQMRLGALKMFCSELLSSLEVSDSERNEWDRKIYIDDILEKRKFSFSNLSKVKGIYFINTSPSSSVVIREREQVDKLLIMYEHLTKQIRSNRYALTSLDFPIPSFELDEYMESRYDLAKRIVDTVPIYDAKGDVLKLVKQIEGRL